jgi:peroxiredoxin Q/BCP
MTASEFSLPDADGSIRKLSDYRGSWVVLYFYPKDDTPGCTKEACGFRDSLTELKKLGVSVLGVSKDSVASHRKFADKYGLTFPLLSDESKTVLKAYGAWGKKRFLGKDIEGTLRKTFLIDPDGTIFKSYDKVNPTQHADEIIRDLSGLTARKATAG